MTYRILKGEELGFEYLQKIMDIDEEVYSDLGMEGALGQMEKHCHTRHPIENCFSKNTALQ